MISKGKLCRMARNCLRNTYQQIIELIYNKNITIDELQLYIDNCPSALTVITQAQRKQQQMQYKEAYKAALHSDLLEDTITMVKSRITICEEEYRMLDLKEVYDPEDIERKKEDLTKLQQRLEQDNQVLHSLEVILAERNAKRPRGRPRKDKPGIDVGGGAGETTQDD